MNPPLLPRNTLWLVLPPIALCALDFGLTLLGQPDAYWSGGYSEVWQISPSFKSYMQMHPLVFVGAELLWMAIFSAVILLLPEKLALAVAMAVVIGHTTGAASWLFYGLDRYDFYQYQICNVMFLLTAGLVVMSFKRGQNSDGLAAFDWQRTGLPAPLRWVVIAGLSVLPIWWFWIPH